MPQCSSESSLVSTVSSPVRLDSGNLVVHDESGYHNRVDLEEVNYTNRELVNLENAAVNIENSSDVIIGPVTHFNVNGNVTIYQNGQENPDGENINRDENNAQATGGNAKLPKNDKFPYFDAKHIVKRRACKLLVFLLLAVVLLIISTVIIVNIVNSNSSANDLIQPTNNSIPLDGGNHNLLSKEEWGGRPAFSYKNITHPVKMVVVKHTGGRRCNDFQDCAGMAQTIQSNDVAHGLPDIYCNFLIGAEGNVYEGRGFDAQPEYHSKMYDVVFFGSFDFDYPTNESLDALKALLRYAVKMNKLDKNYKLVNHNQTYPTQSPGLHLIKEIMKFPHYDPGQFFSQPLV